MLLVQFIPAFKARFLAYGKTAEPVAPGYKDKKAPPDTTPASLFLDKVARLKLPRSWFAHFYVACVVCNLFWGWQIATHGSVYRLFSSWVAAEKEWKEGDKPVVGGQTVYQVVVCWMLLLIQGSRRLYECIYVSKSGTSKMWVGHYFLGIGYYVVMSIAVWVEGTGLHYPLSCCAINRADHDGPLVAIDKFDFTISSVHSLIGPPSAKSFFGILLFILASGMQHDCHTYLASLKKYTLPAHPAFDLIVCPHYFAECVIYLALAIMSAPRGRGVVLNTTMVTGLLFVGSCLGCSSLMSREWYEGKFGRHTVEREFLSFSLSLFVYPY